MSQIDEKKTIIHAIPKDEIISNENLLIQNFWAENQDLDSDQKTYTNPLAICEKFLQDADKTILIYTPYLTSDKLQILLENQFKSGIHIYVLTKDIIIHEKLFKCGVMRQREKIDSTFIIIDHQDKSKCQGIWFSGDLTKKNNNQRLILNCDEDQIDNLTLWFEISFWNSKTDELFFGTKRKCKELLDGIQNQYPEMNAIAPIAELETVLKDQEIIEIWLDNLNYNKLESYCAEAEKIVLNFNNSTKKKVDFELFINKNVQGTTEPFPFYYIKTKDTNILYTEDLIIQLNDQQNLDLEKFFNSWPWCFYRTDKIKNQSNPLLLFESNWETPIPISIKNEELLQLTDFICGNMMEWLDAYQNDTILKPSVPPNKIYALTIKQIWSIKPPELPKSNKDRLYEKWNKFDDLFHKKVQQLSEKVSTETNDDEKYKNKKLKKQHIARKGTWKDFISELNQINQLDLQSVRDLIEIENKINHIFEIETEFDNQLNELNKSREGSPDQDEESEENEISEISSSSHNTKKDKKKKQMQQSQQNLSKEHLIECLPDNFLPEIGELYEGSDMKYLCINYIEDIEKANQILNSYPHVKIVCKKV